MLHVVQPGLKKALEQATLIFCEETNKATSIELGQALDQLRHTA